MDFLSSFQDFCIFSTLHCILLKSKYAHYFSDKITHLCKWHFLAHPISLLSKLAINRRAHCLPSRPLFLVIATFIILMNNETNVPTDLTRQGNCTVCAKSENCKMQKLCLPSEPSRDSMSGD